jgi:hypothetical protein
VNCGNGWSLSRRRMTKKVHKERGCMPQISTFQHRFFDAVCQNGITTCSIEGGLDGWPSCETGRLWFSGMPFGAVFVTGPFVVPLATRWARLCIRVSASDLSSLSFFFFSYSISLVLCLLFFFLQLLDGVRKLLSCFFSSDKGRSSNTIN